MISFQPTEDEIAFVDVSKKFADKSLRPMMREAEASEEIPNSIVKELNELGFLQLEESESVDGLALPLTTQVQIHRALAYGDLAMVQGLPGLNDGASFLRVTTNHQLEDLFINKPETIAYISAVNDQAFATLQFRNNRLSGTSLPVRLAKIATHFLIAIKNEAQETVLLLLPYEKDKLEIRGENRLGLAAAQIGTVTFHEKEITAEHVVAVGEEAEAIIREAEMRIHVLQAAKQVGTMEAACNYVTEYTATRKAFGQEIAKFQAVSFRIAKMVTELRVTNHFVLEAANAIDEQQENAHQKARKTIYQAHKAIKYVTDSAVQLLGGHGFVQDYPVEKWMRDAQAQVMLYGNTDCFRLAYGMELLDANEKVVIG